jgi:hypothetical protein
MDASIPIQTPSRGLPIPAQEMSAHARFSDSAGARHRSPIAMPSVAFAPFHLLGLRNEVISELNSPPVLSPVNASPRPRGSSRHDSGPVWFARPSPEDSSILYLLPVLIGAFRTSPFFSGTLTLTAPDTFAQCARTEKSQAASF